MPSESLEAVEEAASQEIGTRVSATGFRIGAGSLGKLTVCFVDQLGPSAFAKFPLTMRARGSLAHEEETIKLLDRFDRLHPHVPDVISALDLGGTRGVLFSAGPVGQVHRPGEEVSSFLATLHELTARETTLQESSLVDSWRERLCSRRALLGSTRSSLVEDAILLVQDAVGHGPVEHSTAHGDFTRWNLRQGADGLFVFDWEASVTPALPYHDLFHFFAAESALRSRPSPRSRFSGKRISAIAERVSPRWTRLQPALYAAYLIQTVVWYAGVRDWNTRAREGPFWRFLWTELAEIARAPGFLIR